MDETTPTGTPEDVERELRERALATAVEDPPHPIQAPPVGRPSMRRRAHGRVVAGVAGGLADRWGVPSLLLRVPFGLAALLYLAIVFNLLTNESLVDADHYGLSGSTFAIATLALIAYAGLWWFVPREDETASPARRFVSRYPGMRAWPGLALLGLGVTLLANQLGFLDPIAVVALGLIAFGVWLYRRDERAHAPAVVDRGAGATVVAEAPPGATIARAPRPPRERSPLGWIVFGASLLASCLAAIALQAHAGGIDRIASVPALGLLVLGAGMLVASVFGRARWLILPAVLLLPVTLLSSVVRLPLEGRYGDLYLRPRDPGGLAASYQNVAGKVYLDLTNLQGREDLQDSFVHASSVVGDVTVLLPYDASWTAHGYVGMGSIIVGPHSIDSGIEKRLDGHLVSRYEGGPSFSIVLETGIGNVAVIRNAITRQQRRALEREAAREERT